jgi:hypothetical protein
MNATQMDLADQRAKIKADHRINWGRLSPGSSYKADCTCGWSHEGTKEQVRAAVTEHETEF